MHNDGDSTIFWIIVYIIVGTGAGNARLTSMPPYNGSTGEFLQSHNFHLRHFTKVDERTPPASLVLLPSTPNTTPEVPPSTNIFTPPAIPSLASDGYAHLHTANRPGLVQVQHNTKHPPSWYSLPNSLTSPRRSTASPDSLSTITGTTDGPEEGHDATKIVVCP